MRLAAISLIAVCGAPPVLDAGVDASVDAGLCDPSGTWTLRYSGACATSQTETLTVWLDGGVTSRLSSVEPVTTQCRLEDGGLRPAEVFHPSYVEAFDPAQCALVVSAQIVHCNPYGDGSCRQRSLRLRFGGDAVAGDGGVNCWSWDGCQSMGEVTITGNREP